MRPVRSLPAGADPPIGCCTRAPVEVHEADPHAAEVAERLIALIAASWPGAAAEHAGSSAVPGLPGKGIIDLLLPTTPADIARVTQALFGLGFQRQVPRPSRPPGQCCGVSCTMGRPTIGSTSTWCRAQAPRWPPWAASGTPCGPTRR
jgi:GrpB-like predicted nucleotidyltransferase (UPF0157 family)